ncbi:s-isoprenylcysteine o-methyltransferase protein [Rutstroemia sp. NJR-2017a BVV2]|nr:s-isoprenylcysteine o-methyltransferase protein [Rutstroemia sp. NJR-2017a BVV2]
MATAHTNGALNGEAHREIDESNSTTARRRPWEILENGGIAPLNQSTPGRPQNSSPTIDEALNTFERQYYPSKPKSLSGIAIRSLLVGIVLTVSVQSTIYLLFLAPSPLWRIPFFISSLAIFHFLEFWVTAAYNTPAAQISSFLFSGNGSAYNIAHSTAILECLLTNLFFPNRSLLPPNTHLPILLLGFFLILLGQTIRTMAMMEAGTNFNHIVQYTKARTHSLVTSGIYGYLRHPSYFGFFWWGLGTQMVLGNPICFVGYTVALWRFFNRRIKGEEALLVKFFGDEYVEYRQRTVVGIPFA